MEAREKQPEKFRTSGTDAEGEYQTPDEVAVNTTVSKCDYCGENICDEGIIHIRCGGVYATECPRCYAEGNFLMLIRAALGVNRSTGD